MLHSHTQHAPVVPPFSLSMHAPPPLPPVSALRSSSVPVRPAVTPQTAPWSGLQTDFRALNVEWGEALTQVRRPSDSAVSHSALLCAHHWKKTRGVESTGKELIIWLGRGSGWA